MIALSLVVAIIGYLVARFVNRRAGVVIVALDLIAYIVIVFIPYLQGAQ